MNGGNVAKKIKKKKSTRMVRGCPPGCDACCVVLEVKATRSPARSPCSFLEECEKGRRCGVYARRPVPCREFGCAYTIDPGFPDWATPTAAGVLAKFDVGQFGIVVTVDELEDGSGDMGPAQRLIGELVAQGRLIVLRRVDGTRAIFGPAERLEEVELRLRATHPKAFEVGSITVG